MKKANRIGILEGGSSAEAEVSRSSAAQINAGSKGTGLPNPVDRHRPNPANRSNPSIQTRRNLSRSAWSLSGKMAPSGFLEILAIPYVGSNVRGSALAMDKSVSKIFDSLAIPTAAGIMVDELPISI